MKTIQLVDSLSGTELKAFSSVIALVNKKTTKTLFFFLLKNKKKRAVLARSAIFTAVFTVEYSPSKDYLLRNELRLLNQLLEKFIAQQRMDTRDEKFLFLQSIMERGLADLFEKEVKKEIKKRKAEDDYAGLARLQQLVLNQNLKSKALKEINLTRDVELSNQLSFYENKANFYRQGEIKMTTAYLVRQLHIIGVDTPFVYPKVPVEYDDAYLQYLRCKAEGFVSLGQKKKERLQKALQLLDDIDYYKIKKAEAQISMLNNLAIEYLLAFEYENAVQSFEQLLEHKLPSLSQAYILFNYLTSLLKSEQYEKGIEVIEMQISEASTNVVILGKISSVKAMAWIYVGDLDKAYAALPLNLKEGSRGDYFYARLVLAIIYYLESNYDIAQREVDNILQTIGDKKELSPAKFCAQSFRKFFAIQLKPQKKESLLSTVNAFITPEVPHSDLLPLLWLRGMLKKG